MTKLAESSGVVIHEDNNKLYISKRPAAWISTFLFITGLIASILLANGVMQFIMFRDREGSSTIGLILIGIAVVFLIVFWRVRIYQKKVNSIPVHQLKTIAIFDFGNNNLLDGHENILAPLDQAYLTRKMQLTSSSPKLLIKWSRGSLSIVKGNPFSGGIAGIENMLLSKGIRKK